MKCDYLKKRAKPETADHVDRSEHKEFDGPLKNRETDFSLL
jgi:hypothetical protein